MSMADAATRLFDAQVRHAVYLNRLYSGIAERSLSEFSGSDRLFIAAVRDAFDDLRRNGQKTARRRISRLESLLKTTGTIRSEAVALVATKLRSELRDLVAAELQFQQLSIVSSVGLKEFSISKLPTGAYAIAKSAPYSGRTFEEWVRGFRATDTVRLATELRAAFTMGVSASDLVNRLISTVLPFAHRQVDALARTSASHFTNSARETFFSENSDVIQALRWTSVLDSRTSLICAERDGRIAPLPGQRIPASVSGKRLDPPDARPPAHPNCRSIMVAVLSPDGVVGDLDKVTDIRGKVEREIDFAAIADEKGLSVAEVRSAWAAEMVGATPARATYESWLARQPRWFQAEILGETRASLFRDGGLSLDRFTDYRGGRYTVADLRRLDAEAFRRAGVR